MTDTAWMRALTTPAPSVEEALAALPLLVGPAHRFAWQGLDASGDRPRAAQHLSRLLPLLLERAPGLTAILDWWRVAALGERAVANAWDVGRELPGPTGEALLAVLHLRGERPLHKLHRPHRFAEVLDRLEALASTHSGKIAPAVRILKEAGSEVTTLVQAARAGGAPPKGLRLDGIDPAGIEAWAAEAQGGRAIDPGTPVWEHVTRGLRERADLVAEALRLWPDAGPPPVELPPGWRAEVEDACTPHHELAAQLVADVLADPPVRPGLAPSPAAFQVPPPDEARWPVFALAREAFAAAHAELPAWARAAAAELQAVRERADRLADSPRPQVAEYGREARAAAAALDIAAAREWLATGEEELGKASVDATAERRRAAVRERRAELERIGHPVPPEQADLDRDEADVNLAVAEARRVLGRRLDELSDRLVVLKRLPVEDFDVVRTRQLLAKNQLDPARLLSARIRERVDEARAEDDARLGPELARRRDALPARPDRLELLRVLDLAAARAAAGLDTTPVLADLDLLLASPAPAAVAVDDLTTRDVRRLAWVPAGMRAQGGDARSRTRARGVWVCGGGPADVARVRGWGEGGRAPTADLEQGRFYRLEAGEVSGPWKPDGGELGAEHRWGAVGALPVAEFRALFGAVDVGDARWLVPYPPYLEELLAAGARVVDVLDEGRLATWLAAEVEGAVLPERVERWLARAQGLGLPAPVYAARVARLEGLLGRARALDAATRRAVDGYLASPAGAAAVAEAAERAVRADEAALRARLAEREQALRAEIEALESRRDAADARLSELCEDVADAERLFEDRRTMVLGRILGGATPTDVARPGAAPLAAAPIRAEPLVATDVPPLPELVRRVADDTWDPEDVANLLVSVLTGRWTLLAGLPGVGKSTFVRSVLSRLGHGPRSGRHLELVVRRDWQDDTPLFGFWHPTHHAWEPSSEGFVEHLLRALDDQRRGLGGVYPVLIEELNLASPEYYLARPISALEAAEPLVRLYDPELAPHNAARYPSELPVPDSVRLLATVNVDDTVERLSPRFLSRASVIWVEAPPGPSTWRPDRDEPRVVARWDALTAGLAGPADLGDVDRLLRFLAERRVPGAPTPRTRAAIARFLGASAGLIDRRRAEDLQILQRVLPPLRGVGPRWRALLEELATLLERGGWARSAARTRELRVRGEELGDWYDFFHT